jgi:hypothetical protein
MDDEHSQTPPETGPTTPLSETASPLPPGAQELLDLVAQAGAGNTSVLPRLREVLNEHPEVWRHAGNLALMTQKMWINDIIGGDPFVAESITRQAAALKVELEGASPTPLERLLVGQVVASWLETQSAQITLALPSQTVRQARHSVHHAEVA